MKYLFLALFFFALLLVDRFLTISVSGFVGDIAAILTVAFIFFGVI